MPVPKSKQGKFSTVVAAQTARMEKKGESPSAANKKAKGMADKAIADEPMQSSRSMKKIAHPQMDKAPAAPAPKKKGKGCC